jgi:hypothetical protein
MKITKRQLRQIIKETVGGEVAPGWGPAPVRFTVGDLKRAIAGLPDDTPVVNGAHEFGWTNSDGIEVLDGMVPLPESDFGEHWTGSGELDAENAVGPEQTIVVIN